MNLFPTNDFPWRAHKQDGRFTNLASGTAPSLRDILRWKLGLLAVENPTGAAQGWVTDEPYPTQVSPNLDVIHAPARGVIQVTWLGHSTFLIQIAGNAFLTDPHFSGFCSPIPFNSMRRQTPVGISIGDLPHVDGVLLSHSHYDHLDESSIRALARPRGSELNASNSSPKYSQTSSVGAPPLFLCPSGVGAIIHRWDAPGITEFTWGESTIWRDESGNGTKRATHVEKSPIQITCLPAQHGSARTPFDRNETLWCGWLLECQGRKIAFLGDTGYAPFFSELGERFGPLDLALIPIGAYRPRSLMRGVHLDPTEAVRVHQDIRAKRSIAMHWGTFLLADDPMHEAPLMLEHARKDAGIAPDAFSILSIGQTLSV